jgi:hypothetical protein
LSVCSKIKRNVAQALLPVLIAEHGSVDRHCKSGLERSDII